MPSHHYLFRHFFAYGNACFLDIHDNVAGKHCYHGDIAPRNEPEIFKVLLYLGRTAYTLDGVFLADACKIQRHYKHPLLPRGN